MKIVLIFFLVGLSWNGVRAIAPFPNMSLFLTILLFSVVLMITGMKLADGKQVRAQIDIPIFLICLFLPVSLLLSFFVNYLGTLTGLGFGRMMLYSMPLVVYVSVVLVREVLNVSLDWILKVIVIGFFLTMTIVAAEFSLRFMLGFELLQFLPRTRGELRATVAVDGIRILRPAGFSTEPTVIAFYINCLGAVSLYLLFVSNLSILVKLGGLLVTLIAAAVTFSPAILAVILVTTIFFTVRTIKHRFVWRMKSFRFSMLALFLLLPLSFFTPDGLFRRTVSALQRYIQGFETGGSRRAVRVTEAISEFLSTNDLGLMFFGRGSAAFTGEWAMRHGSSPNNAYVVFLLETGVIGFALFIFLILLVLARLMTCASPVAPFLAIGLIAGAMHLFVVSIFFYPFFLILLPLSCLVASSGRAGNQASVGAYETTINGRPRQL